MPGTRIGGLKASKTNKKLYGENFYQLIGAAGGRKSEGGGFTNNPELARRAGSIGRKAPRRDKNALKI